MKVVVTDISRDYIELKANGRTREVASGQEYRVNFFYQINKNIFESHTRMMHEGNLSFDEAEKIISLQLEGVIPND